MFEIVISLIGLFAAFRIYVLSGYKQVALVFLVLMLVPPGVPAFKVLLNQLVIVAFLASTLSNKNWVGNFKAFPLKKTAWFLFISMLIIGVFDDRLTYAISFSNKLVRPTIFVLENFLVCVLVFVALLKTTKYDKLFHALIKLFVIIGVYGAICYVTTSNPYNAFIASVFNLRDITYDYMHAGTERGAQISSIFFHPYLYSFMLTMVVAVILYYYGNSRYFNKKLLLVIVALMFANIYFTGSRTIVLIIVLIVGFYMVLVATGDKILQYVVLAPFLAVLLYQIPQVQNATQSAMDLVSGNSETSGSSVDMRQGQLLISYKYFLDDPITGNGFNYLQENIGFATDIDKRRSDEDAFGFESYFFILLIEQGLVGIIAHIVVFVSLISYHVTSLRRVKDLKLKRFVAWSLALVVGYLIFILATGTIYTMVFFFGFMGLSLSIQEKARSQREAIQL